MIKSSSEWPDWNLEIFYVYVLYLPLTYCQGNVNLYIKNYFSDFSAKTTILLCLLYIYVYIYKSKYIHMYIYRERDR